MYTNLRRNIQHGSRDRLAYPLSEFGPRQSLDSWHILFGNPFGLYLVNINVYTSVHQTIHIVTEIGSVSLFCRFLTSAKPRPLGNVIWQYLGLVLVNINAYTPCYQNFSARYKLWGQFHVFTNLYLAKPRQVVKHAQIALSYFLSVLSGRSIQHLSI